MNFDINEQEMISENIDDAFRFFRQILEDPSILDRIPEGARLSIVSNETSTHAAERSAIAREHATDSFVVGDQTIYVLAVPAKDRAAD